MGLRANPTYRQRRFGAEVRKLRERAGLNVGESADVMGMHQSHISNVETGRTSLSEDRLRALAAAAGEVREEFVRALVEMARASGKGWWSAYRHDLPAPHLDFAELEASVERLDAYEPLFIPGLLQTREYAAAIHRDGYGQGSPAWQDIAVDFRMRRQKVLTEEGAPKLHVITHEAALRPSLGDREVMRDQLLKLIEVSRCPNVTVQVLPFDGPVPYGTAFTLAEPSLPDLGTVIVPQVDGSLYLGDADSLAQYNETFARLKRLALPAVDAAMAPEAQVRKDSLGLIQRLLYPLL
ncbi:helix-turn-helix transcriptional regulator [Streptomyces varsoviensis]|uniref:helix-turn-helix domain-containing protein n=1 Tax=Streptomyces varsoviensis TaxID=67373 RepID=UPI00340B5CF6